MVIGLWMAVILLWVNLWAEPRGITARIPEEKGIAAGQAATGLPAQRQISGTEVSLPELRDDWIAIDSLQMDTWLDAGKHLGLLFNSNLQNVQTCTNMNLLTDTAEQAIAKSPAWVQPSLANVFRQLEAYDQDIWGSVILNAVDPYVDEIAFSIANSSALYLSSIYADPQMMVENAQMLYTADNQLPYVQINNYGNSVSGGDYYSTTSYWKTTADSQLVQVEVPREIYYWYIVHPKITDEIPAYIDPAIVESNTTHANNIASPPTGQFWRTFFYNAEEGDYPNLADTLMQCATVWNRNGAPSDAIRAIQWWINHTMSFTSNSERPHQPVRIYRKHIGRCGEYADYTSAAARTALIPCTEISSISTDHVWNEFWEDGWVQWEPVNGYINSPLVYENGWGKVFGSVFETRSDGCMSPVTQRYSDGLCTLNIAVVDSLQHPVDGAKLYLAIYEGGIRIDNIGFTDAQGLCSFPVGENRHYYIRAESPVGLCPANPGTYLSLVESSVNGETYNYTLELSGAIAYPQITAVPPPTDNVNDWQMAVYFQVPHQVIRGTVTWDDIDIVGPKPWFYKELAQTGTASLLMTDPDNYIFYEIAQSCDAFNSLYNVQNGSAVFNVPAATDWYAFVDNSYHVANTVHVTGGILYLHYGVANEDETIPAARFRLLGSYPNPFRDKTEIRFSLPAETEVEVSIYNLKGQKVREFSHSAFKAGINILQWDGNDNHDRLAAAGIYVIRMSSGKQSVSRKLLLLN